jgi:HEAT repeat protein
VAPTESEAYEQHWYRIMKSLAERRAPARMGAAHDELPRPELATDDAARMAQLAALDAVEALGDIGGAGAVTALIECLDDPDAPVRIRVIEMLGDLGDRRAVPALRSVAGRDRDPDVVAVAKQALTRLDAP